jgi:TatD DNase family protein
VVDSHCHLADESFVEDQAAVIERARDAGLVHALCVVDPLNPEEATRAASAAVLWPALRTALGVHPHRAGECEGGAAGAADLVRRQLAADPLARAIGEIGLDYHYDLSPRATQREVFARQLDLAAELGLPVIIHTREADADTLDGLRAAGPGTVTGVFHCFSGDTSLARAAVDLGFYVSFSGIVTFPKADEIREAITVVPDDRLLVETDCPYLAPVPRRGKRNEPAWVGHVVARVAEVRGAPAGRIAALVTANFERLFNP